MYYVPDGTTLAGFYECKECSNRFLSIQVGPSLVCPYCGEQPNMEIGPDEEMPVATETAKLISDIAAALELEASGGAGGGFSGSASGIVAPANIATFGFTGDDKLTINLKPSADGKSHFMLVEVVFSMNTGKQASK